MPADTEDRPQLDDDALGSDVDEGEEFTLENLGRPSLASVQREVEARSGGLQSPRHPEHREADDGDRNNFRDTLGRESDDDPLTEEEGDDDDLESEEDDEAEARASRQPPAKPGKNSQQPPPDDAQDEAIFAALQAHAGIDLRGQYKSGREALKGLVEARQALSRRDEAAHYGRMLLEDPEGFYAALGQRLGKTNQGGQQPSQQQQDDTNPAPKTNKIPEFDPTWENWWDTAKGEWKPNTPADVVSGYAKFQAAVQQRQRDLLTNFDAEVEKAIGPKLQERDKKIAELEAQLKLRDQLSQQTAQQTQAWQELRALVTPHASWCFTDGKSYESGLTPAGETFNRHLQEALQPTETGVHRFPFLADAVQYAYDRTAREIASAGSGRTVNKDERQQRSQRITHTPGSARREASGGGDPWRNKTPSRNDLAAELSKLRFGEE